MYEYGVALPKLLQPVALMAPVRESSYFPPLDKCLDGRHQLLYVSKMAHSNGTLIVPQVMENDLYRSHPVGEYLP